MNQSSKDSSNPELTRTSAAIKAGNVWSVGLVALVGAGALVAWSVSVPIFQAVPTDISRIGVLLDALDENAVESRFVVLGNSVAMESLDTHVVTDALPSEPAGLNLGTTGQSSMESYLYFQELPASVEVALLFLSPPSLTGTNQIVAQKYNAFYMFGYRPDSRTYRDLADIFDPRKENILATSDVGQRFASRWAVRTAINRAMRGALRKDLDLGRSTNDLYFPASGAERLSPRKFERSIRNQFAGLKSTFSPKRPKVELLQSMLARGRSQGVDVVLVASPLHPAARAYRGDAWFEQVREFYRTFSEANNVLVIDVMELLPEERFVDALHPDNEGAREISRFIAAELMRAGRLGAN